MNERRDSADQKPHATHAPLNMFERDLHTLENEFNLSESFQKYLMAELEISEDAADNLYNQMVRRRYLSRPDGTSDSADQAKEEYRLAIFKIVVPLYQSQNSIEDFEAWLPRAYSSIMPIDGRHSTETCLHSAGMSDHHCEMGECPVKLIREETVKELTSPIVGPDNIPRFDYLVDHDKACRQRLSMLTRAAMYKVISPDRSQQLKHNYIDMFNEYRDGVTRPRSRQ